MIAEIVQFDIRPRYRGIVQAVIDGVRQGRLRTGERLPTQRELAQELGVAVATVGKAYTELESQGFISSHVGRGTFVTGQRKAQSEATERADARVEMGIYRVPVPPLQAAFESTMQAMLQEAGENSLLASTAVAGAYEHRQALSDWVSRYGIEVSPDKLIVTNGAQHAAMCALSTLTHAGELIATEELTDPRMKAVVSYLDRRLVGVRMDADGLIPDALDAICRAEPVTAVYCTPRCQNPTNSMMPLSRRKELVEVARRHAVPIIESDIYGTVAPPDGIPPIAALAPERTHFLTGLARIFGPGMKIGCVVSPLAEVARMEAGLAMSTGFATPIAAELAVRWIRDGTVETSIAWQREEIRRRLEVLSRFALLSKARSHPVSPHVWLQLPGLWRADEFVEAAALQQVVLAPTHSFVVGRRSLPHAVRLCIGAPLTIGALEAACERLERMLGTSPRSNRNVA